MSESKLKEEQPMVIHYQGKTYTDFSQIPFDRVPTGEVRDFDFEIENKSQNTLVEITFISNVPEQISQQTKMPIKAVVASLPKEVGPGKKMPGKITINGTNLFYLSGDVKSILFGISYGEERRFF